MIAGAFMTVVFVWILLRGIAQREHAARKAWEVRHPYRMPWED